MQQAVRAFSAAKAVIFSRGALVAVGGGCFVATALWLHPANHRPSQFPQEMRVPKEMTILERLQARIQRARRTNNVSQTEVKSWISDRAPQPLMVMGLNRTAQHRGNHASTHSSAAEVEQLMQSWEAASEAAEQTDQETLLPRWAWGLGLIMVMPLWPWAYVVGRKQRISGDVANRFGQFGRSFDADLKRRADNHESTRTLRRAYQQSREAAAAAEERARRQAEGPAERAARLKREQQWRTVRERAETQARQRAAHAWR